MLFKRAENIDVPLVTVARIRRTPNGHVCGLLCKNEAKLISPYGLLIASCSEELASCFLGGGVDNQEGNRCLSTFGEEKSKFCWLKQHQRGGTGEEISAEAELN